MAATGFVYAGAGENYNDGGNRSWSNPGNVVSDNSVNATSSLNVGTYIRTQKLRATNFNFSSIPDGSVVTKIEARYNRFRASTIGAVDENVQLLVGGAETGDNKASATGWPTTTSSTATYTWDTALPTLEEIKASNFGVSLKVRCTSGSTAANVSVDYAAMQITYLPPITSSGGASSTSAAVSGASILGVFSAGAAIAGAAVVGGVSTLIGMATGMLRAIRIRRRM